MDGKNKNTEAWALITGGSSGIGLEFSRQLASRGYNLIIASRDGERLEKAAEEVRRKFCVGVQAVHADLSLDADIDKLAHIICDKNRNIDFVVNDAGFALHDSLLEEDTRRQQNAFSVMAKAVLVLSGAAARSMKARGYGKIINVASTSAWLFAGNYSALKRWVLTYSQSLALELEGTGVNVTAICPSWVKTNFHAAGGVDRPSLPKWVWVSADKVVSTALKYSNRKKVVVIATVRWRLAIFIAKHFEFISKLVSKKLLRNRLRELAEKKPARMED